MCLQSFSTLQLRKTILHCQVVYFVIACMEIQASFSPYKNRNNIVDLENYHVINCPVLNKYHQKVKNVEVETQWYW